MEILTNIRPITFLQKLKTFALKLKYQGKFISDGPVRIMGDLPTLKLPGNSKITIGKKVVLNSDHKNSNTALAYNCTLVCGLQGQITIDDDTMLNGVAITAYQKVSIGKNCQIASNTLIADTDFHPIDSSLRLKESLGHKFDHSLVNKSPIQIGNNVWIGWNCTVLKGVSIGDNSIIAAGSVVVSNIPANVLAAGNPAVVKKQLIS